MASNSGYPNLYVGQRLTATLAQSMLPFQAWKTTGTTRTSTTSRTADPDLVLPVEANALYVLRYFFIVSCIANTSGMSMSWTVPSGASGTHSFSGLQHSSGSTPTASSQDVNTTFDIATGTGTGIIPSGTQPVTGVQGIGWIDTAATAGNLTLTWAQLTSSANGTTLNAGSFIELKRVE